MQATTILRKNKPDTCWVVSGWDKGPLGRSWNLEEKRIPSKLSVETVKLISSTRYSLDQYGAGYWGVNENSTNFVTTTDRTFGFKVQNIRTGQYRIVRPSDFFATFEECEPIWNELAHKQLLEQQAKQKEEAREQAVRDEAKAKATKINDSVRKLLAQVSGTELADKVMFNLDYRMDYEMKLEVNPVTGNEYKKQYKLIPIGSVNFGHAAITEFMELLMTIQDIQNENTV